MIKHLDLFSGIGGFALACEWAGIETIGFVEIDKYCQKVLRKHWLNVPIVEDIRDAEKIKEVVANALSNGCEGRYTQTRRTKRAGEQGGVCQSKGEDISERGSDRNTIHPAILITAGFPCQPFSVAGKRQSERDDRYLWPETIAVIKAIKPQWILLENVTGIINLALDTVLSDLEGADYSYETLIIPACAVNAPHRRDRIWIVAYSGRQGVYQRRSIDDVERESPRQRGMGENGIPKGHYSEGEVVANTKRERQSRGSLPSDRGNEPADKQDRNQSRSEVEQYLRVWAVEPELGRVAYGIPNRVDRLKCLGNAIVPQVAYQILKVITEMKDG